MLFPTCPPATDRKRSLSIWEPLKSWEVRSGPCFLGLKKICLLGTNNISHFIICSCLPLFKKFLRTSSRLIFQMLLYSEVFCTDLRRVSPSGHTAASLRLHWVWKSGVLPLTLGSQTEAAQWDVTVEPPSAKQRPERLLGSFCGWNEPRLGKGWHGWHSVALYCLQRTFTEITWLIFPCRIF